MAPKSEVYVIEAEKNIRDKVEVNGGFEKEYKYEDALDVIGFGIIQLAALIVCGLILMAVLCETMGVMIFGMAAQCDLGLGPFEKGLLNGVTFLGILISSYLWGYLADTYGRRKIIVYCTFCTVFITFISTLTNNYWLFLVLRFICGVCISGPSATIYAYLGEFNNVKNRQVTISWASIFVGFATTFMPGIGWLVLPYKWSFPIYEGLDFCPWKLLLIIYSLPGLIGAIGICFLPESPKFLLSQNREREAYAILAWVYEKNSRKSADEFAVKRLLVEGDKEYLDNIAANKKCMDIFKSIWRQTIPLLRSPNLRNLLICCIAQFGIFFSSSGMGLWFPEIQNSVSSVETENSYTVCQLIDVISVKKFSNNNTEPVICDDSVNTKVFIDSIILGLSYIVGYIILAVIINPIGRGIILPVLLIVSGLSGMLLNSVTDSLAIVVLFCGFLMLAGLCVSVVNGAIVDLTPTHLRGMAVCIQLSMGRLGTIVGSNIIGWLLYENCNLTFYFISSFVIFCGLIVLLLPRRTE